MIKLVELIQSPEEKINSILNANTYPTFIKLLKKHADDDKVQQLLKIGLNDGNISGDAFRYFKVDLEIKKLIPTQRQIDLEKTLKNILEDDINILSYLHNDSISVGDPIIVCNGKYIIDGHHRWSTAYCLNPNLKIVCINIEGIQNWEDVLKSLQLQMAIENGSDIPESDIKGKNIFKTNESYIENYIFNNIKDSVVNDIYAFIKNDMNEFEKKKKIVCNYICKNIKLLKKIKIPKTASNRNIMPQTGESPVLRSLFK